MDFASYSFSRLRWKGRDTVFAVFLGALMVPSIFTLLPNFVLVKQLHLIDTFLEVTLPTMFMTPFAVFFLKQFFMNIPHLDRLNMEEGARKFIVSLVKALLYLIIVFIIAERLGISSNSLAAVIGSAGIAVKLA